MGCGPYDPIWSQRPVGDGFNTLIDSDDKMDQSFVNELIFFPLESLILAQDERWRRA